MAEAGVRRGPLSLLASSQLLNPKMNYLIRQFWSVRKLSNSSFFPWSLTWFLLPSNIYICILSSWLPYHFSWQFTLLVSWAHWKQFCMKLFGCSWVWSMFIVMMFPCTEYESALKNGISSFTGCLRKPPCVTWTNVHCFPRNISILCILRERKCKSLYFSCVPSPRLTWFTWKWE